MPKKKPAQRPSTTTTTRGTRAPAKARQTYIEGTEPLHIEELEDLLASYELHKRDRMTALQAEVEAKQDLILKLKELADELPIDADGNHFYRSVDQQKTVAIEPAGEKLRVVKLKSEEDD